jgi:hypothetical protein
MKSKGLRILCFNKMMMIRTIAWKGEGQSMIRIERQGCTECVDKLAGIS